jgi:hypothetical protein
MDYALAAYHRGDRVEAERLCRLLLDAMLPFNPHDWRWMLDREDSIWYPTARVFRQPTNGDWASVVSRVDEELFRQFGPRG